MQKITLITGSTLGGAEYVADHLDSLLQQQGFNTELFNNAELTDIQNKPILLVVTSTYGAGELPDNIKPLFAILANGHINLDSMRFGVVGLGSSDYDTFCNAVSIVEQTLIANGAIQLCDSLKIDVVNQADHDAVAEKWLPSFVQKIA